MPWCQQLPDGGRLHVRGEQLHGGEGEVVARHKLAEARAAHAPRIRHRHEPHPGHGAQHVAAQLLHPGPHLALPQRGVSCVVKLTT